MADNNPRDIQRPEGAPAQAETKAEIEREPSNDHLEYTKFADVDINDKALTAEAKAATDTEHQLGVWQGIKTYKRAVFWSVIISGTVIMEGYDTTLLWSFMGFPAFRRKYGVYVNEESGYQIPTQWQQGMNGLSAVGNILGAMLNGWATARYGHRITLMVSLAFMAASIFVVFFAPTIEVQAFGQFLVNIPWGVFATSGPAYAAEVAPLAIRGHLTAYVNLCWCIGQFISAGVFKALIDNDTDNSYKIPFAIQWVWPLPLFIGIYFAPESPWFLVRKGRLQEARKSLTRLSEPDHNIDHDAVIAMMVHTDKLEKEEMAGTTYLEAFKGTNRRRTEIACMAFLSQITDGGAMCYSGAYFFQQTGISESASYAIALAGTGIAFCGTIVSWFWISKVGRRNIWLWGFYILVAVLFMIGILACVEPQTVSLAWGQSILCIIWLGAYSMTVGPIVYTIVAEIGSTRLRTQTVVLGRSTYYVGNIIGGQIHPQFMNPTGWNAKGKTAFFWGVLAFLTTVWGFFRLPETKDRTFGEMDIMFQKKIPSRKFSSYKLSSDEQFLTREADEREKAIAQ